MSIEMKVPPITMGPMDESTTKDARIAEERAEDASSTAEVIRHQSGRLYALGLDDLAAEARSLADKIPTGNPLLKDEDEGEEGILQALRRVQEGGRL